MSKLSLTAFAAICTVFTLTAASGAKNDEWKATFAKHWATSATFTLAVADAMPAKDYAFKPTPEEMSFGEQMTHIAQADINYFGRATGMTGPKKPDTTDKEAVMKFLNDSFDFCTKSLSSVSDDQLDKMIGPEGKQMSAKEQLWGGFTHTAHHRGSADVYLRLKGITPPAYKF